MKFLQRISAEWPLRLGLGAMYLYSGYDLIVNPRHWYGFVPQWFSRGVTQIAPIDTYLTIQGVGELLVAFLFLVWFLPRWGVKLAAVLSMFEMALILIFVGVDPITFRDVGLLGAAVSVLALTGRGYKTQQ